MLIFGAKISVFILFFSFYMIYDDYRSSTFLSWYDPFFCYNSWVHGDCSQERRHEPASHPVHDPTDPGDHNRGRHLQRGRPHCQRRRLFGTLPRGLDSLNLSGRGQNWREVLLQICNSLTCGLALRVHINKVLNNCDPYICTWGYITYFFLSICGKITWRA